MWADVLIGLGIAILIGVAVVAYQQRGGGATERRRSRAIAEATGRRHDPLPEGEQEHADEIHALVEEYRTGELPKIVELPEIVEPRGPSVRDVARKYARKPKHGKRRVPKSKRFDPLTSPMPVTEQAVMLPARQPEIDLETFTGEWEAGSRFVRPLNGARR